MPNVAKDPKKEHLEDRIPGAVFFDVDDCSSHSTELPHMLPTVEEFTAKMKELGIPRNSEIVCYDNVGIFSSPRVAWTFKFFGADRVRVLNGGFKKWKMEKKPTEKGEWKKPVDF